MLGVVDRVYGIIGLTRGFPVGDLGVVSAKRCVPCPTDDLREAIKGPLLCGGREDPDPVGPFGSRDVFRPTQGLFLLQKDELPVLIT